MDHDNDISNHSGNRPFQDVLQARATRRGVVSGSLAAAAGGFFAANGALARPDRDDLPPFARYGRGRRGGQQALIGFNPIPATEGSGSDPNISSDYEMQVIIPWGDPLEPGGPVWSEPRGDETEEEWLARAADQTRQLGIGHDGMHFFPISLARRKYHDGRPDHRDKLDNHLGVLAINHEFGGNFHVLRIADDMDGRQQPAQNLGQVRTSQHAHGVAIVAIGEHKGRWRTLRSRYSRRVHANSEVEFSGPAAGHSLLQTPNGNVPLGTVNNCAHGSTPWGTYLTCEENFNGYFGASNQTSTWVPTEAQERYGFSETGFGYGWHLFDRRFDLSDQDYRNEENRFGWVVEIDPFDPTQRPVKRTALGRFKHESVFLVEGKGRRIVGYMGDDQRFDYIYKFVSADDWTYLRAEGKSPLDHGTLFVARFNDDGTGDWLPLTLDDDRLRARFSDMGDLLVNTRIAADIVGATPMDRPEWTAVGPDRHVYCALTNNSRRETADAANPLAPNPDGHIIRWREQGEDFTATSFEWDIYIIAEDTHGEDDERTFSDPDGIVIDNDGRLFIETDGGQQKGLNNQLVVADTEDPNVIRRLFTGVTGCEITGLTFTPNRRTAFLNVQHPGDGDPALTSFPEPSSGGAIPRDATVVIRRKDGGIVGS